MPYLSALEMCHEKALYKSTFTFMQIISEQISLRDNVKSDLSRDCFVMSLHKVLCLFCAVTFQSKLAANRHNPSCHYTTVFRKLRNIHIPGGPKSEASAYFCLYLSKSDNFGTLRPKQKFITNIVLKNIY